MTKEEAMKAWEPLIDYLDNLAQQDYQKFLQEDAWLLHLTENKISCPMILSLKQFFPKKPKKKNDITEETLSRFQKFIDSYPARNGKKLYQKEALALFAELSVSDQDILWQCAEHYAKSAMVKQGLAIMDPHRFIRRGYGTRKYEPWRDWVTPEESNSNHDYYGVEDQS